MGWCGGGEVGGSQLLVASALGFAHDLDVGPEVVEGGRDFLLAGGEMFVQEVLAAGEAFVEVQLRDLLGEAALDVFDREVAGGGVLGLDDVEEVAVGVSVEEGEVGRGAPGVDPVDVEIEGRIAFDIREGVFGREGGEGGGLVQVEMILYRGEEGE